MLGVETIYLVGFVVLGLAVVALGGFVYAIRKTLRALFKNDVPETKGEALARLLERLQLAEAELAELGAQTETLEAIGKASFQKIGFIRFNPFSDTGGDQSFALALLDRENNGVVISSLYNREGTRVYGKAIEGGVPRQALSDEEKKVLERAMHGS